jgi:hypothetical protein
MKMHLTSEARPLSFMRFASAREIMSRAVLIGRPTNGRKFVITNEEGYVLLEFPFEEAICSG